MSDLLAKCDWLNGDVLVLVLPQDPSSIHVKLFDSKHAPSKVYVPESYPKQRELGADYLRLGKENDKLRELVRDMCAAFVHGNCYRWCEFKDPCNYIDDGKWTELVVENPTPEQAVEATLGRGTCHIVKTWSDSDYDEDWRYRCSECGCHIPVNERDPETGDVISAANYCPNCGRRVES